MSVAIKKPQIGIQDVVFATLTESTDVSGGTPTYGTVTALAGGMKFEMNPNSGLAPLYADDKAAVVASFTGRWQGNVDLYDIEPSSYATIMGMTRASGMEADTYLDQAPWVAIGYKILLYASGSTTYYRYRWLLKCKFGKPQQGGETKKEGIDYKALTLPMEAVPLLANNIIQVSVRTDDSEASATTLTNWFNAPVLSTSVSLSAVTLSSLAGDASAHTITATFGKGSSETFALVAPTDNTQISVSVVSTGLILAGTYTYTASAAGTAPTLTITNSNIANVAYLVAIHGLKDTNGVSVTYVSGLVTPA